MPSMGRGHPHPLPGRKWRQSYILLEERFFNEYALLQPIVAGVLMLEHPLTLPFVDTVSTEERSTDGIVDDDMMGSWVKYGRECKVCGQVEVQKQGNRRRKHHQIHSQHL
ncbi:unnamed protein product [Camellia sinensis]